MVAGWQVYVIVGSCFICDTRHKWYPGTVTQYLAATLFVTLHPQSDRCSEIYL